MKERIEQLEEVIRQTIGWVESTNGDVESIRLLYDVMDCNTSNVYKAYEPDLPYYRKGL